MVRFSTTIRGTETRRGENTGSGDIENVSLSCGSWSTVFPWSLMGSALFFSGKLKRGTRRRALDVGSEVSCALVE